MLSDSKNVTTIRASIDPATTMADSLNVQVPRNQLLDSFGHTETMRTYQQVEKACDNIIEGKKGKQKMGRVEKLEANMTTKKQAHMMKEEVQQKLVSINREQGLKECLSEHQMYAHGSQRLEYLDAIPLLSKEAVDSLKQKNSAQVPNVNYLINQVVPYTFQGKTYLLISFESHKVIIYDYETGHFDDELTFIESYDATELPLDYD
jgi:hypothetical protein